VQSWKAGPPTARPPGWSTAWGLRRSRNAEVVTGATGWPGEAITAIGVTSTLGAGYDQPADRVRHRDRRQNLSLGHPPRLLTWSSLFWHGAGRLTRRG
jgi:hypothetical protein